MIKINGVHNEAIVFTDSVDDTTYAQILELCNQDFVKGSTIRIMPDTHAGAGCTIGTTMTITDKIVPNLVGVDIGCGMFVSFLGVRSDDINFEKLDSVINETIPHGFNVRDNVHPFGEGIDFDSVHANININRSKLSVGTLGAGNHFIEVNDYNGMAMLVVHTGSRNLGKQIAEWHQNRAYKVLKDNEYLVTRKEIIDSLSSEGRFNEIGPALDALKKSSPVIKKDLAYLFGEEMNDYLDDMRIAQEFSMVNRKAIADEIIKGMGWSVTDSFTTVHNYIDMDSMILRKGAISANQGERVIIPVNMRDGSILGEGLGNKYWNYSGPHGAGRILSRSAAHKKLDVAEFKNEMEGIWSSSVGASTLDESPMAYKPLDDIVRFIGESVKIKKIVKPIYNFKSH